MKSIKRLLIFTLIGLLFSQFSCTVESSTKSEEEIVSSKVDSLIAKMTIEEKVAQLMMSKNIMWDKEGNIKIEESKKIFEKGIGFLWFDKEMSPLEEAKSYNKSQKFLIEESRLGIPAFFYGEGLHGVYSPGTTMFPQTLAMASTWDTELVKDIYSVVGQEMRHVGSNWGFTPVLDLARDPRYGRVDETFGEDPYLVANMGVAAIKGLQGNDYIIDENHVAATAKHYVAYSQPQNGINRAPAVVTQRDLLEYYLYPFELAINDAKVKSVMATYNEYDGIPIPASKYLLQDILRKQLGFTGLITSDADAIQHLHAMHFVTNNKKESAKLAIETGIDFDLAIFKKDYCYQYIPELIEEGLLSENTVDRAVRNVLKLKFELNLFDNPYINLDNVNKVVHSKSHKELAEKSAEKAIILLKNNNNLLPLDATKIKNIAVVGVNAKELQFGSYSLDEKVGISILEGLTTYGKEKGGFNVTYSEGARITNEAGKWKVEHNGTLPDPKLEKEKIKQAVEVAKNNDAIVVVVGGNEFTCRESWSDEHLGDRDDLNLLGQQNELVMSLLKTGKPVVVVLINGRPLSINEIDEKADAILEGWFLGEATGTVVAKTIFGDINPGGKLPITFPRSVGQIPCYYNHKPTAHLMPYLFKDSSPLYSFGHGLSYTTFEYSNLTITPENANADQEIIVTVDVKNTGKVNGDEVVQLYIRDDVSSVTRPVKELKGFDRINLNPGETKTVQFEINREKLQFYNVDMKRVVEPGTFKIMVGGNSQDLIIKKLTITE